MLNLSWLTLAKANISIATLGRTGQAIVRHPIPQESKKSTPKHCEFRTHTTISKRRYAIYQGRMTKCYKFTGSLPKLMLLEKLPR